MFRPGTPAAGESSANITHDLEMEIAGRIQVARDGAEAWDFVFCRGPHAERNLENSPKVILLDMKLPKVGRMVPVATHLFTCAV